MFEATRSRRRREVRAVAFARGDGPVYVGLGTADVARYTVDTREHEGWYYYKTLWAIAPSSGPAKEAKAVGSAFDHVERNRRAPRRQARR
jgi:hypothetical protein